MALDLAKYRTLFLEESAEHLSELSAALLELEKDPAASGPIDVAFRMAHSIKSMAASLEYDPVTDLAHALEDRMERIRAAGSVESASDMGPLFAGLEGLENMVAAVRESGEAPPVLADLVARVRGVAPEAQSAAAPPEMVDTPKKKLLS